MKPRLYNDLIHEIKPTSEQQKKETEQKILGEKVAFSNWANNEISKKFFEMLRRRRDVILTECIQGNLTLSEVELRCKLAAVKQLTEQIEGRYYNEGQPDQTIAG